MADVIDLFEYRSAIRAGATVREALGMATLSPLEATERTYSTHICVACGESWRTARGFERHRCKEASAQ